MKIENYSPERIKEIIEKQRAFFASGCTLPYEFRREQLKNLQLALKKWEKALCDALWSDLHKSAEEAILTELSIVSGEVKNHIKHLKGWMRRESRPTPLKMTPSRSRIVSEPLGNALIISPWNYPVQLLLNPLVGAISAGCTAILKPSPYVPETSATIEKMIKETFDEKYVAVVQGNREVNSLLLDERFDLIFFTGSPALGKKVMQAAARNLTPVILELGGKSPCIVDKEANIKIAARRIAWGKTLNAGQTCIAPDYLLIHSSLSEKFATAMREELRRLHGEDACKSKSVKFGYIFRGYKKVISYLVSDKYLSVSVVNDAAGRVDGGVDDGIIFSICLVVIIDDLDAEQLCYENGRCCAETYEKLVFSVEFHGCILLFLFIACEYIHHNESENHVGSKRSSEAGCREPEWSGACSVQEYIQAQEQCGRGQQGEEYF